MPRQSDSLVTVVGSAYFQPIADLVERLVNRKPHRLNRIQSGYDEKGYSAAIVLLLVAMFESYMSRVRFVQSGQVTTNVRSALDVVRAVFPRLRHMSALEDVYVLRDLLMQSHLWEIKYEYGGPVPMVLKQAMLHPGYGDKKFKARVNMRTYRTKAIRLSVFPSRVNRRDVLKVFETIWKTLLRFERKDLNQVSVSNVRVRFGSQHMLFSEIQQKIRNAF